MKITLLLFLLSCLAGTGVWAQQTPAKTTAPASRTLTPAEQRQKEKIEREVQRERQIRAEWLQKQREYEAKQAEKERQKQARKAEKDNQQQVREAAKTAPPPAPAPATPTVPSVSQPAPSAVTSPEPSRAERKQKRRKEPVAEPAPATEPADQNKSSVLPAPVAEPSRAERREQRRKETSAKPAPQPAEPVVVPAAPVEVPRQPKTVRPRRLPRPTAPVADSGATATATSEPAVIRPRKEFLPKGHLFEPILLDPLESQAYGSVLPAYYTEGEKYKGSIVPFAFGFAKPFYRRTTDPGRSEEWVLDVASFTQFEVYYDYIKDKQRRQIMNTDYKVSILYNVRRGLNNYRFRVYHLSSHLGDDYLFRNRITAPSPNSVNYEVIDATYSRVVDTWRLYGGIGIGLRRSEERKRFSAQLGAFYKKSSTHLARLVGGVDIKFWQQTDFRPGIHAGIGVEIGRSQNNLTFLAEGYSGFRPYSQFENQQTVWLGIGMYLNPF